MKRWITWTALGLVVVLMGWGVWRTLPGPGEDHLYVLWRWNDCCATF